MKHDCVSVVVVVLSACSSKHVAVTLPSFFLSPCVYDECRRRNRKKQSAQRKNVIAPTIGVRGNRQCEHVADRCILSCSWIVFQLIISSFVGFQYGLFELQERPKILRRAFDSDRLLLIIEQTILDQDRIGRSRLRLIDFQAVGLVEGYVGLMHGRRRHGSVGSLQSNAERRQSLEHSCVVVTSLRLIVD